MKQISVYKGRTNVIPVSLGYDVSNDTLTSEIREGKSRDTPLIASWNISFVNDGTDGELLFTLDDAVTEAIEQGEGYMDIKRISNGEPLNVIDEVIEVLFRRTITV